MSLQVSAVREEPAVSAGLVIALASAATILGALFFQYVIGLAPCPLCLEQRIPHYIVIPLAALVAFAASRGLASRGLLVVGLLAIVALLVWSTGLGIYHSGVEWKWWKGPQGCSGALQPLGGASGNLLEQIQTSNVVRCDEAAWRFLGLSLAGYNVLISLALAAIALWGVSALRRSPHGSSSVSQ